MTLIPFILDLADELNEFNRSLSTGTGMDIDDFDFGIYPSDQNHFQPQQQQPQYSSILPQRRPRLAAPLFWVPGSLSLRHRHHPYQRGAKTACCNKSVLELEKELSEKETVSTTTGSGTAGVTGKSAYSVVNKHGFQVSMNVKQFASNELTVKTIDNCIVVEGQHDEKEDGHGVISRHFIRKYMLPKGYDPNHVLSTLSSDGILTVKAPPPPPPAVKAADEHLERVVVIQQTGGPAQLPVAKDAQTPTKELPLSKSTPIVKITTTPTPTASASIAAAMEKEQQPKMLSAGSAAVADDLQKSAIGPAEQTVVGATLAAAVAAAAEIVATATTDELASLQKPETTNGDAAIIVQQLQSNAKFGENSASNSLASDVLDTPRAMAATAALANSVFGKNDSTNVNNGTKAAYETAAAAVAADGNAPEELSRTDATLSITASTSASATAGLVNNMEKVVPTNPTKTGELLAANDAAILFAKAQCENGSADSNFAVTAAVAEKIVN